MTPNFQYQLRVFQDIMFGANLVILAQICEWIIVEAFEVFVNKSMEQHTC